MFEENEARSSCARPAFRMSGPDNVVRHCAGVAQLATATFVGRKRAESWLCKKVLKFSGNLREIYRKLWDTLNLR